MEGGELVEEETGITVDAVIVEEEQETLQRQHGDCLPANFSPHLLDKVTASFAQNDLSEIREIWAKMEPSERIRFQKNYGDVGLLLEVEVDEQMLQAALYFWDPSHRCFVFGQHDMVPTVEEYQDLLMIEDYNPKRIYWPRENGLWQRMIASHLGITTDEVRKNMVGDKLPLKYLITVARNRENMKKKVDVIALLIYGAVIFPKDLGFIDAGVMHLFKQLQKKADPTPAIVAETLRSLSYCRKRDGRFTGCAQLLMVWFKSHIRKNNGRRLRFHNKGAQPIKRYLENGWPEEQTEEYWVDWFRNLREEWIIWRAQWMGPKDIPYLDKERPWVPLPGIWGVISYSPLLVKRQYGSLQHIPYTSGINSISLTCNDKEKWAEAKVWGDLYQKMVKQKCEDDSESAKPEYLAWHSKRGKGVKPPSNQDPKPTFSEIEDIVTSLNIEVQRLKDGSGVNELNQRVATLEEEKKALELQVLRFQSKALKKKHRLHNEKIRRAEAEIQTEKQGTELKVQDKQLSKVKRKNFLQKMLIQKDTKKLRKLRESNQQMWEERKSMAAINAKLTLKVKRDKDVQRLEKELNEEKSKSEEMSRQYTERWMQERAEKERVIKDRGLEVEQNDWIIQNLEDELKTERKGHTEYRKWAEDEVVKSHKEKWRMEREKDDEMKQSEELVQFLAKAREKIKILQNASELGRENAKLTEKVDDLMNDCLAMSVRQEMAEREAEWWKGSYEEMVGGLSEGTSRAQEMIARAHDLHGNLDRAHEVAYFLKDAVELGDRFIQYSEQANERLRRED